MHGNDRAGWPAANECKEIKQGRSGLNNKEESRQACVWFLGSGLMRRFERFISTSLCRNGRHGAYVGVPDSSQSCCVDKGLLDEVGMTPAKPLVSMSRLPEATRRQWGCSRRSSPCSRAAVQPYSRAWTAISCVDTTSRRLTSEFPNALKVVGSHMVKQLRQQPCSWRGEASRHSRACAVPRRFASSSVLPPGEQGWDL
jgi:hypothetical protein